MIRISTRGRYALRAMVDLAQRIDEEPVSRQDLAQRQEISPDYVAQLFRGLQAAGLVEGIKGPGGGYRLAKDPASITAGAVVRAVEGPIAVVPCVLSGPSEDPACSRMDLCTTHQLWVRLSDTIAEFLDSVTVLDLCDEAQQRLLWAAETERVPDPPGRSPVPGVSLSDSKGG